MAKTTDKKPSPKTSGAPAIETTTTTATGAGNPVVGDQGATAPGGQAQLIVNGQFVKDLSFENANILRMMQASGQQPDVSIDLGVDVQGIAEDSYEVSLQIHVETKRDGVTGFIVELTYAGLFTLKGWEADQIEPLLFIEGPKLLFPFARMIISNLTRDGGHPALNLNPIDFAQLYRRRLQQQAAQASEKALSVVN